MMDGRVAAIREALDAEGYTNVRWALRRGQGGRARARGGAGVWSALALHGAANCQCGGLPAPACLPFHPSYFPSCPAPCLPALHCSIMAYTAKYASAFYGPFR